MTAAVASTSSPRRRWAARLWDRSVEQVLHFLLLAGVAVAVATLVVPPMRDYTGVHEQVIGLVVVMLGVVELASSRLRQLVDWLLYGQRQDPATASASLARPLQDVDDEHALGALLAALAETLRLTHVSVRLSAQDEPLRLGVEPAVVFTVPIRRSGRDLGELRAARRGLPLDRRDERLLEAAAAQIGLVVHALGLAADIKAARDGLVVGVADERRHLRREIHDGIGPTLAGIALGVESAENALDHDVARAHRLLSGVRADVGELVAEVRHVVEGLRPALLDELGLPNALRELARGFENRTSCRFVVDDRLDSALPAAVEVAAYRIASEALTNSVRHAAAGTVRITLKTAGDVLVLRLADDGRGGAVGRPGGTGLASMRERAEELGGSLDVRSTDGGTTVVARLPLVGGTP